MLSYLNRNVGNTRPWFTSSLEPRIWLFHVDVLQKAAETCIKVYNARANPFYCSLNLSTGHEMVRCKKKNSSMSGKGQEIFFKSIDVLKKSQRKLK